MAITRANSVVCLLLCLVVVASDQVGASSINETIPSILELPAGNKVQQILFGVGVQIYVYNGTVWNLNNVSADLYNHKGLNIGHHFFLTVKDINGGQPSWETFHPSTRVTGKAIASVQVEGDSINWVLLQATSNIGTKPLFGATTYIQRLYTQHGKAPDASVPAQSGDIFNSTYAALYIFSTNITSA